MRPRIILAFYLTIGYQSLGCSLNGNVVSFSVLDNIWHPADRDKRLHDPHLPSARSKQSARACCPTSVLHVSPFQTHSRDTQLPGTPLRSRDRRPRGARGVVDTPTPGKGCCGRATRVDGLRDRVCWFCAYWYPWQTPVCPRTVPLRAEDCHCPTPNGNMPTICDLDHPMTFTKR